MGGGGGPNFIQQSSENYIHQTDISHINVEISLG